MEAKQTKYVQLLDNFKPNPSQEWWCFIAAKLPEGASISSICKEAGIPRSSYYHWTTIHPYFEEWTKERISYHRMPILQRLEFYAIQKIDDFRFWNILALKHGFLEKKEPAIERKDQIEDPKERVISSSQLLQIKYIGQEDAYMKDATLPLPPNLPPNLPPEIDKIVAKALLKKVLTENK